MTPIIPVTFGRVILNADVADRKMDAFAAISNALGDNRRAVGGQWIVSSLRGPVIEAFPETDQPRAKEDWAKDIARDALNDLGLRGQYKIKDQDNRHL
ncbi:MAG: hypothetical protein AB7P76_00825 [Candidatus Melainabacteria bacterium]